MAKIKKIMKIEGMTCDHCRKRVEQALNGLPGVSAKVNLKKKEAAINLEQETDSEQLLNAVREAGYEPVALEDKKGLFT